MKIISKNPFRDTKLSGYQGYFKKASVVVLAIALFLVVYSLLLSFASPNHYAAAHIGETEAVVESAGGTYIGAVADAYYEGEGEFRHLDGSVYEGSFSKSQRSGQGMFRFANGDVYTGSWANDEMVEGTYTFADGRTYQGKFEDGRFTSGVFSLGSQAAALGFREFSADVEDGALSALNFTQQDGTHYNGALSGWAEIKYADGNTYAGNVQQGVRSGQGTFYWRSADGAEIASYNGGWQDGQMNGSGTYYYTKDTYPKLTGTFKQGVPDGEMRYVKSSSKTFKAIWKDGACTQVKE